MDELSEERKLLMCLRMCYLDLEGQYKEAYKELYRCSGKDNRAMRRCLRNIEDLRLDKQALAERIAELAKNEKN